MFSPGKTSIFSMKFLKLLSLCYLPIAFSQTINSTFDFIIIGGGTSGLLIAERLTDDPSISVAVLEAGQAVVSDTTSVPALFTQFIGSDIDWGFTSVPQKNVDGLVISLPRGKLLGGTSSVNGMYFVRAHQKEYDVWETLGNPGWNWDSVDAHIKTVEAFHPAPADIQQEFGAIDLPSDHGSNGQIQVSYSNFYAPDKFIVGYVNSLNALGINRTTRASGGLTSGVWQSPTAIKPDNRSRSAVGTDFVLAGNKKTNLKIFTGATVSKIILAGGAISGSAGVSATGVQFISGGQNQTVKLTSRGNVIVTAGTYQTPKILELSGIGNPTILNAKGIQTKVNVTGVGENLQDHAGVPVTLEHSANLGQTLEDFTRNTTYAAEQQALYLKNRTGVLASVPGSTLAMLPIQAIVTPERLTELTALLDKAIAGFKGTALEKQYAEQRKLFLDPDVPDYELTLTPGSADSRLPPDDSSHNRELVTVINIRPFSRGNVHLNTTNPLDLPIIDPNFLGITEFELAFLTDGIKFVTKLAQTAPLKDLVTSQLNPAPNATDTELAAYIQQGTFSVWHPCGSASMLPQEQNGVVDANLKIYGTSNIRVADASIIPFEIGAHTLATVYGNALKAAEIFRTLV
ncbi:hypothetical protein QCA50_013237 [Cerrena zonata]|uniref:Glucose-methanol-choline oxidoreductase N-terminal domain-containing protein n=1 Tax=Cerrena zonata TaxID=2478898 RepID=A0AAW0G0B9_9APHY